MILRNKTLATMIALIIMMMTVASPMLNLTIVNAHDPAWTVPTYAYVAASPKTVGVGQYLLIVMWLDKVPATAGGLGGDKWRGFMLDITKPNGTNETQGPFETGPVGTTFTTYTPLEAGNYTFVLRFPGQTLTNGTGVPNFRGAMWVGDYFQPSTSDPLTVTVTQEPTPDWVEPALPEYVTRPINDANRGWSQLASNWLKGSWLVDNFQRAGIAPNSPHVLWTKQLTLGGIQDAQWSGQPTNLHNYEQPFSDPIVMGGRIYFNEPPVGTKAQYGYYCLDLRTGEQLFYKNGTDNGLNNNVNYVGYASGANSAPALHQTFPTLSFGQLYHYNSINGQGIAPSLWMTQGSTWYMLDVDTGNWIMSLRNVPGGTAVTDQDGSILRFSYNANTGLFLCWNSSQSIPPSGPTGTGQQIWKPRLGATIDAVNDASWTAVGPVADQWVASDILPRSGYTMNVTGPTGLPGLSRVFQDDNRVPKAMLFSSFSATPLFGSNEQTFRVAVVNINEHVAPYSPFPDKSGTQNTNLGFGVTQVFDKTLTYPLGGNKTWNMVTSSYNDQVFVIRCKETSQMWGYSLTDGSLLWGPTAPQGAWDMYGISGNVAYGNFYAVGYDGKLYSYSLATGKTNWIYEAKGIGYESPYGDYPLSIGAISDGKVFLFSTEHSPTKPLWRGSYLRAINATDGTEIWKMLDFSNGMAVADGCIVTSSNYDNLIYSIGKGPSATTVTASPEISVQGNSLMIKGSVTDQSPGAKGTPAIADANMQAWMEYIYQQQAKPTDAKGVEVTLQAIDPNNNLVPIGTVTSDTSGMFKKMWTPEIPGEYTVIATFAGSESYGSSYAETAVGVAEANVTPAPTQEPGSMTDSYVLGIGAAAIVAIVIIGLIIILMLRKRP